MADNLAEYGIAVLHSAVRGVHVYRVFPKLGQTLHLEHDKKSVHKHSVGVYLAINRKNCLVGHVAREHAALVSRWLGKGGVVQSVTTGDKIKWSKRAGGHEIAMDIHFISRDEVQMFDMKTSFKRKHYVPQ